MRSHSAVRFIAVASMVLALPAVAFASITRVESLNLQPDYIVERINVQNYPSALVRHQNVVFADFGLTDESSEFMPGDEYPAWEDARRSIGAHFGNWWDGKIGVFGIYLNENAWPLSSAWGSNYINANKNESLNILWANQWGNTAFGLEFNRSSSTSTEADGTVEDPFTGPDSFLSSSSLNTRMFMASALSVAGRQHYNTMGIGAGVSFGWESDGYDNVVDISIEPRWYSFEETNVDTAAGDSKFEDDGGISFAFNARGMLQSNDVLTWIPVINYVTHNLGTKSSGPAGNGVTADNKITGINAGIAANWQVRDTDMIVAGLAFQSTTLDYDDFDSVRDSIQDSQVKITYTQIPTLFLSFEGNIWNWFTYRMGGSKPIYSKLKIEDKSDGSTDEITDSPFVFSLGAGFNFGNFTFDTLLNQDYLFTGGPLAADADSDEAAPFLSISSTYRF